MVFWLNIPILYYYWVMLTWHKCKHVHHTFTKLKMGKTNFLLYFCSSSRSVYGLHIMVFCFNRKEKLKFRNSVIDLKFRGILFCFFALPFSSSLFFWYLLLFSLFFCCFWHFSFFIYFSNGKCKKFNQQKEWKKRKNQYDLIGIDCLQMKIEYANKFVTIQKKTSAFFSRIMEKVLKALKINRYTYKTKTKTKKYKLIDLNGWLQCNG